MARIMFVALLVFAVAGLEAKYGEGYEYGPQMESYGAEKGYEYGTKTEYYGAKRGYEYGTKTEYYGSKKGYEYGPKTEYYGSKRGYEYGPKTEYYGPGKEYGSTWGFGNARKNYYGRFHGFKINRGMFAYGGKSYRLRCNANRFYGLWNNCYNQYRSVNTCFSKLFRQHYFVMKQAALYVKKKLNYIKKTSAAHVAAVGKVASAHTAAIKKVATNHIYTMKKIGNKHVKKVATVASSHLKRFNNAVKAHLYKLTSQMKKQLALKRLQHNKKMADREALHKKNLITRARQNKLQKYYVKKLVAGAKKALSYDVLYRTKYHGFQIAKNGFSYGGKAYSLKCGKDRFEKMWNVCYGVKNSVSGCFDSLYSRKLFGLKTVAAPVAGYSYDYLYKNKYQGLPIINGGFSYKGKDYTLNYGQARFEKYWGVCYRHTSSFGRCFKALYKRKYFALKTAKNYLANVANANKVVASSHVSGINTVAKAHVSKMNKLAAAHTYKMAATANKHVNNIAAVTNQHLYGIKKLINTHIYNVVANTKADLAANAAQHNTQITQRAIQNNKQLVQRAIQNKQQKYYLASTIKNAAAYSKAEEYGTEAGYNSDY